MAAGSTKSFLTTCPRTYHGQLSRLIELLGESGLDFVDQPPGEDIDWDEVRIVPLFAGGFLVIVRGVAPVPTIVTFEPGPEEPLDYAPVHVVGRRAALSVQVETPWEIQTPLERLPHGKVGTVLVGATKREFIPPQDS
jgi:hypothetical protein